MSVKYLFYSWCSIVLGDGRKSRFWEDSWLGNLSLCQKYPRLYYLSLSQNILVNTVFTKGMACLKFRRFLREETLSMWNKFLEDCSQVRQLY
jgi:hypothetical protein